MRRNETKAIGKPPPNWNFCVGKETRVYRLLELEVDMEKVDNNIQLAFLGGMKAGLEALIHGLEVVAENNNGQVSFEFVKMVSASTIADVELKLSSIENGKGLIDVLNNNKSKWINDL